MSVNVLPMFSSSFMVSRLIFQSLSHSECIIYLFIQLYLLVWCDCPNFIDLHSVAQLSQHYQLKRLSFLCCTFCLLCQRLVNHRCMGLFPGSLFCSAVTHVCFCGNTYHVALITVALQCCLKSWKGYSSCFVPFSQDCFVNSVSFMVPYKFQCLLQLGKILITNQT